MSVWKRARDGGKGDDRQVKWEEKRVVKVSDRVRVRAKEKEKEKQPPVHGKTADNIFGMN